MCGSEVVVYKTEPSRPFPGSLDIKSLSNPPRLRSSGSTGTDVLDVYPFYLGRRTEPLSPRNGLMVHTRRDSIGQVRVRTSGVNIVIIVIGGT